MAVRIGCARVGGVDGAIRESRARVGYLWCRGALLFVSVPTTVSESANVSIHSGRSIGVAPTSSAAPRVFSRMSFSDQPASFGLSGVSGNHSPLPAALNLAT